MPQIIEDKHAVFRWLFVDDNRMHWKNVYMLPYLLKRECTCLLQEANLDHLLQRIIYTQLTIFPIVDFMHNWIFSNFVGYRTFNHKKIDFSI